MLKWSSRQATVLYRLSPGEVHILNTSMNIECCQTDIEHILLIDTRSYGAPEGTRKLKSFEWLDCTNNKVLNVAISSR